MGGERIWNSTPGRKDMQRIGSATMKSLTRKPDAQLGYFPARPAATKTDRIMAGQNHNVVQRCALMILSCHDSVGLLRLQKNSSQPASELDYCSPAQRSRNPKIFQ